jgi:hypothetical protein
MESFVRRFLGLVMLTVVPCLLACGCATVTRGFNEVLEVQTTPVGAEVVVYRYSKKAHAEINQTGEVSPKNVRDRWSESAVSPAAFKLFRNNSYLIVAKAPGYRTAVVAVFKKPSGGGALGVAGNVIVGGLVGITVDAISGGANELKPNPVIMTLVPGSGPPLLTASSPKSNPTAEPTSLAKPQKAGKR